MDGYDVVVVGAGPIGLEVAWALKREGLSVVNIEAGEIGSTMGWWAQGTRFFSSPERIAIAGAPLVTAGEEKATREEYLAYLRGVVLQFGLEVRTFERVVGIERVGEGFVLRTIRSAHGVGGPGEWERVKRDVGTDTGTPPSGSRLAHRGASNHLPPSRRGEGGQAAGAEREIRARRVVMALGDMQRPRALGVRGEELGHVNHYFQDPHRYVGRRVLIVGGKNSAVEAAIRCCRVGARVTVSYRGAEFDEGRVKYWLLPELKGLIREGRIAFVPETSVEEIREEVVALRRADGGWVEVPADDVLLLTGYVMDGALLEAAGVEMVGEERRPRFEAGTMETNVPGLYVAGTATAGTQERHRVFIENCHVHAERIAAAVMGRSVKVGERVWGEAES